jgi:hypothetical protein
VAGRPDPGAGERREGRIRRATVATAAMCGWLARPLDGLSGPVHGFFVFYLINQGGHFDHVGKDLFTVTFPPRRLRCPPRLISFACLD